MSLISSGPGLLPEPWRLEMAQLRAELEQTQRALVGAQMAQQEAAENDEKDFQIAELHEQLAIARETNRRLHRRLQAAESPVQSEIEILRQERDAWKTQEVGSWLRMVSAHNELTIIFNMMTEVYEYPQGGRHRHSVMDGTGEKQNGNKVYANCFVTPHGPVQSFHIVSEVHRLVSDYLELKKQQT